MSQHEHDILLSEQSGSPFTMPSPAEMVPLHIRCSLWFDECLPIDHPPPSTRGHRNVYDVTNWDGAPTVQIELRRNGFSFDSFKNILFNLIGSFVPEEPQLRTMLFNANNTSRVEWVYSISENDESRTWTAKSRSDSKFKDFVTAIQTFPDDASVCINLIMDKPACVGRNSEVVIVHEVDDSPPVVISEPSVPRDMSMDEFLVLCKIDPNNHQIKSLLDKHLIFHWSAFKSIKVPKLERLGFGFGASLLIAAGTLKATRETA